MSGINAATIGTAALSVEVDDKACAAKKPANQFQTSDRQIFFTFTAQNVAAGDRLRIEWLDPGGRIFDTVPYDELPAAQALCFVTQLPLSGFPASSHPGEWRVRVTVNEHEIGARTFRITGDPTAGRVRVFNVTRRALGERESEFVLDGAGFDMSSVAHIAEYTKSGGWRYIHSTLPLSVTPNRMTLHGPTLRPGEYIALVKNGDDAVSLPARFLIATDTGYRLPLIAGDRWVVTQTPYGGFSHWNNSLHAWDIAPRSGKLVAAMRGGTVLAHDVGAVQSHTRRTFGNYITIQHDDGEFSHYAHLTAGSFLVKTGDRVEAGQALARVGNSGYTLGEGGGYHVHVHVTKSMPASAQSIPFRFVEFGDVPAASLRSREVIGTTPPTFTAAGGRIIPVKAPAATGDANDLNGSVAAAGTWSDVLRVPQRAKSLEVTLQWPEKDRDLDLHLVSPSGRHYGWYGETAGYSGRASSPERFQIPEPEAGPWRVQVSGMRGSAEAKAFVVHSVVAAADPPKRVIARAARPRSRNSARTP